MDKSESIKSISAALSKAQAVIGHAHKSSDNPFFKSKYADLAEVLDTMRQPFADNGLSMVQMPFHEEGRVGVETLLSHESGEWISNRVSVLPSKTDAQAMGSCITYLRRYSAAAFAGIAQADDDGNAAQHNKTQPVAKPDVISKTQAAEMRKNLKASGIEEKEFVTTGGCKIEEIPKADFSAAMQWIYDNAKDNEQDKAA